MINTIKNQQGVALVTALMFTLISLTILMGLLYLITQGIQTSGSHKRYRTALEASYGGADIALKEVVPYIFQGYSSAGLRNSFPVDMNVQITSQACMWQKLHLPSSQWSASCSSTLNPKSSPDITFQLPAAGPNSQPYSVYTKIVDTVAGNTDTSGLQLEGEGVADSGAVYRPKHLPYLYRVEVQAEKSNKATEHANLDIQYAY